MALFSNFFEPPETKRQRKAAQAATQLREQAARDLSIEVSILVQYINTGMQLHQKVYSAGDMTLAGQFVLTLDEPKKIVDRIERAVPEIRKEIENLQSNATSAASFESLANFEIEIRNSFIKLKEEIKEHLTSVGTLNAKAAEFLCNSR